MTNQEAFDIMVEHLGNLKERSIYGGWCAYNGSKCVVGILMTDEEQEKFGTYKGDVDAMRDKMKEIGHTSHLHQLNLKMLRKMQGLHDNFNNWNDKGFKNWDRVRYVANDFNLEYKGPKV